MFSDADKAHDFFVKLRWPDGVIPCPDCGKTAHYCLATQKRWKCKGCGKQFSLKVGTIFEKSPLGLDKWMMAMWLITNAKNGISSCEVARSLEVTQKTAWFMLHRIRLAMQNGTFELKDHVEVDETYIGGKARNMHVEDRKRKIKGTGGAGSGKAVVVGMLERGGDVRTMHIQKPNKKTLQGIVRGAVVKGSNLYTDALNSYTGLSSHYAHMVVDHAVTYIENGTVHTNGLENYWSLLKRTIRGTYVSVEPFHLHRYLDEQSFRYNERKLTDGERFAIVGSQTSGKRLTYKRLTGKEYAAAA